MIRYLNVQDSQINTKQVQPNQTYSHISVPTVVPQSMNFPINQEVPTPQQILPQYSIPCMNGVPMTYPQNMGPTAIANNLLSMVPPSQMYQNQITAQVGPAVPQPQDIFKKSYIYNSNIPMDNTCGNITAPSTLYNSVSAQPQNRLSRVLPPPSSSRLKSLYSSRSNTTSVTTSRNSSNSVLSARSESNILNKPSQLSSKCSITSQGSVSSVLDVPTSTLEAKCNNNQAYTTSRVPSNTIPTIIATTPVSLVSVHAPTMTSSASSPASVLIKNETEQENQRRHSVTLAGLNNTEENDSKLLDHQPISQNNSHPDLAALTNTSPNFNYYNKVSKPGKLGERYNNKGQLVGKSGKLLRDTKRAAQNRCAQKAFRLRREKYIKDLEEKAEHFDKIMEENERLKRIIEMLKEEKKQKLDQKT